MSYDIGLHCPVSGKELETFSPHEMHGGTYQVVPADLSDRSKWRPSSRRLHLNITYNYSTHYYRVFPGVALMNEAQAKQGDRRLSEADGLHHLGIRTIYGLTGALSIPILEDAISKLGDDVSDDYWAPTEGNAKTALTQLLAMAQLRPDGVWGGD